MKKTNFYSPKKTYPYAHIHIHIHTIYYNGEIQTQ